MNGRNLQPVLLDQQGQAADGVEIQVDTLFFNGLVAELVGEYKSVMVPWILLIKRAVPLRIGMRVPGPLPRGSSQQGTFGTETEVTPGTGVVGSLIRRIDYDGLVD